MGEVSNNPSSLAVGLWDKLEFRPSVKYSNDVANLIKDAAILFKNVPDTSFVFYDFYKCPILWCHQLWKLLILKGVLSR